MKVLVVEDDVGLSDVLSKVLTAHQYQVELADDGESGMALVEAFDYDLVLLDLHLPKLDGIHFCQKLRRAGGDVPILLMTAEDTTASKIAGLDAGADDYVTKPLDTGELLARIRALLRRGQADTSPILGWGPVTLDPSSCEVCCDGQPLKLTGKEYGLLELFLRNQNRIFSLNVLLDRLWTVEKSPSDNAVRTHMKGLRRKLKQSGVEGMIETVYGLGYRLEPEPVSYESVASEPVESEAVGSEPVESEPIDPLQAIWKKHRPRYLGLIACLEKTITVRHAQAGDVTALMVADRAVIEQSQRAIHTLKGALGSFGFMSSSKIAVQIESLLAIAPQLSSEQVEQLSNLVKALRQSLELSASTARKSTTQESTTQESTTQESTKRRRENHSTDRWLVIDSDQVLTEQLMRQSSVWGIQTRVATSLEDAQRALAKYSPTAIVIDPSCAIALEEGLNFLRSLTQTYPTVPITIATDQNTLDNRVKILRFSGGCTVLQKPVTPAQILETVNQQLAQTTKSEASIIALDDDPQILQCLDRLLSPWGFHVTPLSEPVQFWQALKQTPPDLLLLDIEMPKLNGLELCRVIRSDPRFDRLPIVFLTAHTDPDIIRQVFEAGADDYVSKPIAGAELVSRILSRLERLRLLQRLANTERIAAAGERHLS